MPEADSRNARCATPSRSQASSVLTRRMRPLLGTFVEIGIGREGATAEAALRSAFATISKIHSLLSFQHCDSELSRLNGAPTHWVALSPPSLRLLKLARAMTLASNHAFNCTLAGELILRGALPDHGGTFLPRGNAQDIQIEGHRARLRRPVRITLDGIAKGYAVDSGIAALKRHRVQHGWINAGGDLRVFGNQGLDVTQRQLDGSGKSLGRLRNGAMATSQTHVCAEREKPGLIINSAGQLPANIEPAAVFSVISRFAWRADALTKVAATATASERAERVALLGGLLVEADCAPTQQAIEHETALVESE